VPFPSGATIVAQGKFKLIAVLFIAGKIKKEKAASVSFRLERRDEFLLQLCGIIKTTIARADNGREGDEKWSLALRAIIAEQPSPPAEMRKAAERERAEPHIHTHSLELRRLLLQSARDLCISTGRSLPGEELIRCSLATGG
jgi:hypothetical protein